MKRSIEDVVWFALFDGNLQIKVGVKGAEKFGEYEEWFNYRLSRAAPETCAEFLGSFVADRESKQFSSGGKWLVWKFEVLWNHFVEQINHFLFLLSNNVHFGILALELQHKYVKWTGSDIVSFWTRTLPHSIL